MTDLPPLPWGARRDIILSRLPGASMVLPAAPVRFMSGDSEYRYRPDSELLYATGWGAPDCVAVLRGFAAEDRFVLFVPGRDPKAELWTGPRLDADEVRERFGADAVYPLRELPERGPRMLAGGDTIHYRLGASAGCDEVVREALRRGRPRRARQGAGAHVVAEPGAVLDGMRVRKDAAEIARMKEAARITVEAFRDGLACVRAGAGEWEVEAALDGGFRRRGAQRPRIPDDRGRGGERMHAALCGQQCADRAGRPGADRCGGRLRLARGRHHAHRAGAGAARGGAPGGIRDRAGGAPGGDRGVWGRAGRSPGCTERQAG